MIKLPKGTRDYYGEEYYTMKFLKDTAKSVFEKFQGTPLETPSFERRDVLTSKYGEEEKLIFNLEGKDDDVEGETTSDDTTKKELVSLRYDQTVPFVRFVLMNKIDKAKRYSIGPVYRRETTSAKITRLRQFYQADFDFVGTFDENLPELQIFMMLNLFFSEIGVEDYVIRYNFRQLLYSYVVEEAKVPIEKFREVCASLDKLDKRTWEEVTSELLERGIKEEQITKIKDCIISKAIPSESKIESIFTNFNIKLAEYGITNVKFDTSLARGLDYYTGIIFEVNVKGLDSSVAGGGRYDKLINSYDSSKDIPMIGFSLGLDRILNLLESKKVSKPTVIAFTIISGADEEMKVMLNKIKSQVITQILRTKYSIDFCFNDKKTRKNLSKIAADPNYRFAVIIGKSEADEGMVCIKNLSTREQVKVDIEKVGKYLTDNYY